jgi:hypothetical protein
VNTATAYQVRNDTDVALVEYVAYLFWNTHCLDKALWLT